MNRGVCVFGCVLVCAFIGCKPQAETMKPKPQSQPQVVTNSSQPAQSLQSVSGVYVSRRPDLDLTKRLILRGDGTGSYGVRHQGEIAEQALTWSFSGSSIVCKCDEALGLNGPFKPSKGGLIDAHGTQWEKTK